MIRLVTLAALLAAGGCSEPAENVPAIENAAPVGDRTPEVAAPANGASPAPATRLPQPLLGAWTADKTGNCAADNELRIDIAPARIDYHESRARVTRVTPVGERSWGVDAEFSGEGEAWTRSFDLNLSADGRTLTRVEAPVADITYTRCETSR